MRTFVFLRPQKLLSRCFSRYLSSISSQSKFFFFSTNSNYRQPSTCLDTWTEILDRGSNADTIYLDFSKAFDSVPHMRLCRKLENYAIVNNVHTWLKNFLDNRRQRVVVNGDESKWVFKIPQIPKIPKVSPKVAKYGIQCINPVQIKWKTLIGSGSYGKIYNGIYNNSPVALKYLSNVEDDQILKEAGFLSKLEHPNIVKFFGMCPEEKTIVLEYLCFSLVPFGSNSVVNNLEELLGELNKCNMIGFEHLIPIIAKHVVSGLTYLHNEGVAHRDIKPGNIIVSNQHMTNRNMESEWKLNPITAKLTDFGESWGKITTTSSITQTHTLNAFKGTMAFMAPEVIESRGIVRRTSEGDMQKSDVWSLGMLFFCLLNPSYKAPYYKEYKKQHLPWEDFIKMQIVGPSLPENCETYNYLHVTDWIGVFEAYKACLKNDPKERSSLGNLWNILEETILPHFYQLRCHQGSVLELSQKKSLNSDTIFEIPLNDGTNACTFLTLKIAEFLLNLEFTAWETLVKPIECIIKYFPQDINPIRDIEKHYEVGEALQILHINGYLKDIEVNFICESCDVFSDDGKQDLLSVLKNSRDVYAVTVPPYTFLVGWLHDSYICIDTHVIDTCVGGNNNGIIVIFSNYVHAARWIWKRLVASGIRRAPVQMVKVIISDPKSYPHSPLHHTTFEYNTSVYQTSNEEPKLEYNNASEDHRTTKHPTTTKDPTIVYHTPIHVQSPVKNTIQDKTLVDLHHQTIREQIPISTIVDHSSVNQHSPESSSFYLEPKMDPKKSNSCNFWNNKPVKYFGLKRLPYIPFVTKKLSHSELMALVMSKAAKCVGVPQGCRKNSVFLIDNRSLKDPTDLKSDLNGTFSKSIEVKTMTVIVSEISGVFSVHAKHRSKVELDTPHLYLNVHRVKNVHGLIRNISYFFDKAEEILNSAIVVQYIVDQAVAGEVDEVTFEVKSHGNRNVSEKSTPFHPVKKSTISAIKIDSRLGKRGSSSIYTESMSKTDGIRDFGDFPRSKKQIADIANKTPGHSKTTAMDEVEALLAFNHELEGDQVIWHHSDLPSDLWVLGTRRMIFNLKVYTGQPISVDPTFNYGKYEVTPFTYRHPLIQSKSKHTSEWVNAVMIGPTVIQHSKAEDVYDGAFRVIAHKTGLKDAKIGILTDGEQALINALKPNFPKAVHMRCTNHFKSNCKEFLLQKGISGSSQEVCLDMIFGENGIIEAENKKQLHTELKNLEQILLELGEEGRLFFEYIKDREKSVLRKLIRDNRRNGGMEEQHGIPVRVYTNQSETCNSMLAAKKKALGYTKKDDLSKSTFIKEIWMDLVKSQDIELEKALYGQSERFRLIPAAKYLQVEIEDWYQLTGTQKRSYVEDFNAMSYTDIQTNKAIVLKEDSSDMSRQVKEKLSVSLPRSLPFVPHASLLEKKAEDLLNSPNTISIAPTHDVVDNNKISYLVAGNNTTYSVTLRNDTVTCKCKSFRYLNICSHSVAIAEKHHVLRLHISKVKVHKRNSLTYPVDQHGSGRKGNAIRQKRFYRPTGSPPKKGLFTKIWHNNEPFLILKSNTITPNKSHCQQCNNEFPRGALSIIPYDIVLSHSERWEYLNRDRTSLDDPKYLPSPAGKMSTKYYCVRKECIFQRFPYFTPSLIQPSVDFELRESHFKLLKEELDYNPIN